MLNRRILRIKAMQALYSYFTGRESLREVILAQLLAKYELDPAVHDFADREIFNERQERIGKVFNQILAEGKATDPLGLDEEIISDAQNSVIKYHDLIQRESKIIQQRMVDEAKAVFKNYLKLLMIPGELAFIEKQDKEKREKAFIPKTDTWNFHLIDNPYIEHLESLPKLVTLSVEHKVSWKADHEVLKSWYKDVLKKDETFTVFHQKPGYTQEEMQDFIKYLFKKQIFGQETMENFWMEKDIQWAENKEVLRSMVMKTLKSYNPDQEEKFDLMPLTSNEADDFQYFENLFKETISRDAHLEEIIQKSAKNWDLSRFAATDMAIIKLALTEMMTCHSIPVKVTINEFIEVSKTYSTPKSKQFINGILDVLANKLTSDGLIRKSGRGLIDNK